MQARSTGRPTVRVTEIHDPPPATTASAMAR
jgi:hypothetical protein